MFLSTTTLTNWHITIYIFDSMIFKLIINICIDNDDIHFLWKGLSNTNFSVTWKETEDKIMNSWNV